MKNLKYALALTLSTAAFVSCQENMDMVAIEAPAQSETIILTAAAPATPATRITPSVTGEGLKFQWFGGNPWNYPDKITVYDKTTGERVGNFIINERNKSVDIATFSPVGDGMIADSDAPNKYDVAYASAEFSLADDHTFVAVFPASGAATLAGRNTESINPYQYSSEFGGWRDSARMISDEFTTDNPSLTFTHETAFMSIEFLTSDSEALPKAFNCTAGDKTTSMPMGGYAKSATYTAHFPIYPTTESQLKFTITDSKEVTTIVTRNIGAEIEAGKYYKQSLIETVVTPTGDNIIYNGDFEEVVADKNWVIPGINAYSGGFNATRDATGGMDGTKCIKYALEDPFKANAKVVFNKFIDQATVPVGMYCFSIDVKSSVDCNIGVKFQDSSNNQKCNIIFNDSSLVAGEWKTLTGFVNVDAADCVSMVIPLDPVGAGGVFMFDNASLVIGTGEQTMVLEK